MEMIVWKSIQRQELLLKTSKILFFCGPSNGNNDELKSFHYSLAGMSVSVDSQASNFMEYWKNRKYRSRANFNGNGRRGNISRASDNARGDKS